MKWAPPQCPTAVVQKLRGPGVGLDRSDQQHILRVIKYHWLLWDVQVRGLAQAVLAQRTEVEMFLVTSLELVRPCYCWLLSLYHGKRGKQPTLSSTRLTKM